MGRTSRSSISRRPLTTHTTLNHAVFVGTLTQPMLKPWEKPYVIIGVNMVLG
jgi:hypothetical protein